MLFFKNKDNQTFNTANILPVIGFAIGSVAGAAAINPAFLGSLATTLGLLGFTPALFGVVAAFLMIGSVYQIYNNRKIAVAEQEAEAAIKAAENNNVLEGLTEGVKAELKQASIISETVKGQGNGQDQGQNKETLYLQLSADAYTAFTAGKNPGDVITLHAFINGEDVKVECKQTAPAAAPTGANASAAPAKVELISVGGKTDLPGMKEALKMKDNQLLNVAVSDKTREGLRGVANSSLMKILAEQVVTKVVGAPAPSAS